MASGFDSYCDSDQHAIHFQDPGACEEAFAPWSGTALATSEWTKPTADTELRVPFEGTQPEPERVETYYDPFGWQFAYGADRKQAYVLGWYTYDDYTLLPMSRAIGIAGAFRSQDWNSSVRYSTVIPEWKLLLSGTLEWNNRFWNGPQGVAMPPGIDQFALSLQALSNHAGPWNWQLGFRPQIASDFRRNLNSEGVMFDGRGAILYQASNQWSFALGAVVWDRAHVLALPQGGVVWNASERWEVRLMFPKSRVSYYAGNHLGTDLWLYGSAGYDVQAYQIDVDNTHVKDRGELSDWRLMLGVNGTRGNWTTFCEGGWALDRHVRFAGSTPGFDLSNTLMFSVGILR